ncbi:hypothetical protein [Rhizobium oryziradicis]|nr:hypothetical protein [Rhizobium oryziradicis]
MNATDTGGASGAPTAVQVAAMWISTHEDDIRGPRIPFIRSKFGLNILEAVEASRLAHKLRFAGGR